MENTTLIDAKTEETASSPPSEDSATIIAVLNAQIEEQRQWDETKQQLQGYADELTVLSASAQLDPNELDNISEVISQLRGAKRGVNVGALINRANKEIIGLTDDPSAHMHYADVNGTKLSAEAKEILDTAEYTMQERLARNDTVFILANELARSEVMNLRSTKDLEGSHIDQLLMTEAVAALSREQRQLLSSSLGNASYDSFIHLLHSSENKGDLSIHHINECCEKMHHPASRERHDAEKIMAIASLAIALEVGREIVDAHIKQQRAQHHSIEETPSFRIGSGRVATHEGRLEKAPPTMELLPHPVN